MVPYYGDFPEDATVYIPINTFDSNDPAASVTVTNLLNTDVHIHKNGGLTQRNNAAGITMTIDYDSITGNHLLVIDTSDETVAGFWVAGAEYQVRIEGATIDAGTINAWIGAFSIERTGGALANSKELLTRIPDATAGATNGLTICGSNAATIFATLTSTGALTTGSIVNNGVLTQTGAVTLTAGINAGAISGTLAGDFITATSLKADAVTKIIDDFETQSAADPTGFKVNVMEINGTAQTAGDVGIKTGFALSATGADLILKSSTFIQAIVAAVNELATYGLTALNTLLVTTGIKVASEADHDFTATQKTSLNAATPASVQNIAEQTGDAYAEAVLVHAHAATLLTNVADLHTDVGTAIADIAATHVHAAEAETQATAANAHAHTLNTDWADGGRLDLLLDVSASGAGAGAITWTYTLTNSVGGAPITDADIWITSDIAGTTVIASGKTNSSGVCTFYLDAGTVYVWRQKTGFDFTNPDTEVVS